MERANMLASFYPTFSESVDGTRDCLVALINRVLKRMWDLRLKVHLCEYHVNNKDLSNLMDLSVKLDCVHRDVESKRECEFPYLHKLLIDKMEDMGRPVKS